MQPTVLTTHPSFAIAAVESTIFGGFLEHMGRCVYEGIYDPTSVHADEHGCRTDVLGALAELAFSVIRYPGGNFASGYHWRDGVGPADARPTVRELAWQSIEPNRFGTDEFVALCRRMNWEPMLAVNLGTGTPEEARDWVEYCNAAVGTRIADLRAANTGNPEPHGVRLWCLGNEMDGPWQLGHVPAREYATRAQQAAKMMKDLDPNVRTVACGSSNPLMPTFGSWDYEVLDCLGQHADYISLHRYVDNNADDTPAFVASGVLIDRQIEQIDAVCRAVQAKHRSRHRAMLCFDEWNVWYKNMEMDGAGTFAPHLIEEVYNLEDALVVAQFLNSFIRHADVVKIANLAQIVNVIAPVLTRGDEILIQSIFHPLRMMSSRREGTALRIAVEGPEYAIGQRTRAHVVDASVILGPEALHLFVVNRSVDTDAPIEFTVAGHALGRVTSAELLTATGPKTANTWESPGVVAPVAGPAVDVDDSTATFAIPPLSFAALSFAVPG